MARLTRLLVLTGLVTPACTSSDDTSGDGLAEGGETSVATTTGDDGGGTEPVLPSVEGVTFVDAVDNPYFPLPVGARWVIEARTDEGLERIEVEVTADTREIQGVTATVVRDTVTVEGEIVEDTYDWFAQDEAGNVWYLGEDTCEFEDGVCVAMTGAWEWGVDGALPGIIMPANPAVDGRPYYQEFYEGQAEDVGEVVEVGVSVSVPAGTFDDCIVTRDTTPLEPDVQERKTYCAGVGNVLIEDGEVSEELIEYQL
jgi:hypothetical protein